MWRPLAHDVSCMYVRDLLMARGPGPQMPLVTTAEMVGATHRDGCGITAYNVIKLEHAEAIVAAADRIDFHRGQVEPILTAVRAVAAQADVPVGTRSGSARLSSRRHRRSNVQRSSLPRTSSGRSSRPSQ